MHARRSRHLERSRLYRTAVAVAGFTLLAAGLALLALPGPGWPLIALGLFMLALEFAWAERILERVLGRIERASRLAAGRGSVQRILGMLLFALAAVGIVAALLVWDVPKLPV